MINRESTDISRESEKVGYQNRKYQPMILVDIKIRKCKTQEGDKYRERERKLKIDR